MSHLLIEIVTICNLQCSNLNVNKYMKPNLSNWYFLLDDVTYKFSLATPILSNRLRANVISYLSK